MDADINRMGGRVAFVEVVKTFSDVVAVDHVNLEIQPGEFFSLLGPSGCGKTTSLRMIAGFEQPSSGRILLDGEDMSQTPPYRRNVNTVFQSYALFPHLSVEENVAFGLKRHKVPKVETRVRVAEVLRLVRLEGLERRRSTQLSGGQQQRVALARALVLNPAVLLLDEPLGALDAKLRKDLQIELKALQQEVGITFVYVTHDQEEALTMSDQIAVMADGKIEQVGTPQEVYEEPATSFVAEFLGSSNLMDGLLVARNGATDRVRVGGFELFAEHRRTRATGDVKVTIRPERVNLEPYAETNEPNRVPGIVERAVYVGSAQRVIVRLATGDTLHAVIQNDGSRSPWAQGAPVCAHLPTNAVHLLVKQADEPAAAGDTAAILGSQA